MCVNIIKKFTKTCVMMLKNLQKRDKFSNFKNDDLKDYVKFNDTLIEFRSFYKLEKYSPKEIDQYLWQLGKEYFPNNYNK